MIKPYSINTFFTLTLLSIILILYSPFNEAKDIIKGLEVLHSPAFDMDFEHKDPLENWEISGDHDKRITETKMHYEGKQALYLSTKNSLNKFPQSILSQTLHTSFERDFISFSGFIRYEKANINGTFNVFLTTYDENHEQANSKYIEYKFIDNTDWQEFNITLPISHEVSYVNIGGVLNGQGNVWIDDLLISFPKTHKENQL